MSLYSRTVPVPSSQSTAVPGVKEWGNTALKEGNDFIPYRLLTQSLLEAPPGPSPGASPAQKERVKFLTTAIAGIPEPHMVGIPTAKVRGVQKCRNILSPSGGIFCTFLKAETSAACKAS